MSHPSESSYEPADETIDEVRSSLPIPAGPLHSRYTDADDGAKRPSFWKRIKMRRRAVESVVEASASETAARLDTIEQTVEHFDTTLQAQLEALNARLEDVWESEEQLSHLAVGQQYGRAAVQGAVGLRRALVAVLGERRHSGLGAAAAVLRRLRLQLPPRAQRHQPLLVAMSVVVTSTAVSPATMMMVLLLFLLVRERQRVLQLSDALDER